MSFIKKYLQNVDQIIEAINVSPKLYYIGNYKVDAFIGSKDSINLTNEFIEKYSEDPEQDFSELTTKYKN
jgi:hypothetical protein